MIEMHTPTLFFNCCVEAGEPRQRIIMHLGTIELPENRWKELAFLLEQRYLGQMSFTSRYPYLEQMADDLFARAEFVQARPVAEQKAKDERDLVTVDLNSVRTSQSRSLGPGLALYNKETELFKLGRRLFLFDLTNTYFEGNGRENSLAHRAKSKEKRMDCPLVSLALLVDDQGFPAYSRILKGNQSEPETLEAVLEDLSSKTELRLDEQKPNLAMDRGTATTENLKLIRQNGYDYTDSRVWHARIISPRDH